MSESEIPDVVRRQYLEVHKVNGKPNASILAIALRDERARANRAEFLLDCKCSLNGLALDQHHTWTWEQWQAAAHKELTGE